MKRSSLVKHAEKLAELTGFDLIGESWLAEPTDLYAVDPDLPKALWEFLSEVLIDQRTSENPGETDLEALTLQVERNTRAIRQIQTKLWLLEGDYTSVAEWCRHHDTSHLEQVSLNDLAWDFCCHEDLDTKVAIEPEVGPVTTYSPLVLKYLFTK